MRWTDTAESLTRAYTNLTGDMLIAGGIIAYAGGPAALSDSAVLEVPMGPGLRGRFKPIHQTAAKISSPLFFLTMPAHRRLHRRIPHARH